MTKVLITLGKAAFLAKILKLILVGLQQTALHGHRASATPLRKERPACRRNTRCPTKSALYKEI